MNDATTGRVERTTLRLTAVRDLDGVPHSFPNGTLSQVSNLTKEWAPVALEVGVAYEEAPKRSSPASQTS